MYIHMVINAICVAIHQIVESVYFFVSRLVEVKQKQHVHWTVGLE